MGAPGEYPVWTPSPRDAEEMTKLVHRAYSLEVGLMRHAVTREGEGVADLLRKSADRLNEEADALRLLANHFDDRPAPAPSSEESGSSPRIQTDDSGTRLHFEEVERPAALAEMVAALACAPCMCSSSFRCYRCKGIEAARSIGLEINYAHAWSLVEPSPQRTPEEQKDAERAEVRRIVAAARSLVECADEFGDDNEALSDDLAVLEAAVDREPCPNLSEVLL